MALWHSRTHCTGVGLAARRQQPVVPLSDANSMQPSAPMPCCASRAQGQCKFAKKVLACPDPHTCSSTGPGSSASSLQAHMGVSLYSAPVLPLSAVGHMACQQPKLTHGLNHFRSCCDGLQSKAAQSKLEMPDDSTFPRFMRASGTGHRLQIFCQAARQQHAVVPQVLQLVTMRDISRDAYGFEVRAMHWFNAGYAMTRSPLHGAATPAAPCQAEAGPAGEEGVCGAVQQVRAAVGEGGERARAALGGLPRRAARRRARARQVPPPACGTQAERGWAAASRRAAKPVQRSVSRQRGRAGARATTPPQHCRLRPPDCASQLLLQHWAARWTAPAAPDTWRAGRAAGPARRRRWGSWRSTWCAAAPWPPARSSPPGSSSCARWCRPASRWCAARAPAAAQCAAPGGRAAPAARPRVAAEAARARRRCAASCGRSCCAPRRRARPGSTRAWWPRRWGGGAGGGCGGPTCRGCRAWTSAPAGLRACLAAL